MSDTKNEWITTLLNAIPEPVKSNEGIAVFIPYINKAVKGLIDDANKHSKLNIMLEEVDVKECINEVGLDMFNEFVLNFSKNASPIISSSFMSKFKTKFKELEEVKEGEFYKSGDFVYVVLEGNKTLKKVKIADMMYNSAEEEWEANVSGAFYIDTYKLISDYERTVLN